MDGKVLLRMVDEFQRKDSSEPCSGDREYYIKILKRHAEKIANRSGLSDSLVSDIYEAIYCAHQAGRHWHYNEE